MQKIIGIYNANGTLLGEMRYVFEKVFFKKHCALCDITHGLFYKAKPAWLDSCRHVGCAPRTVKSDAGFVNVNVINNVQGDTLPSTIYLIC